MNGRELHAVLCQATGIANERGSRKLVSAVLGVAYGRYRTYTGPSPEQPPLGAVLNLCSRAGVAVVVLPKGPERGRVEIMNPGPVVASLVIEVPDA